LEAKVDSLLGMHGVVAKADFCPALPESKNANSTWRPANLLAVQLSRGGVPKNGTQNGYMANAHCKPPALHSLQITPPNHTLFICKYIPRKKPTKIHHVHVHLLLFTFSLDSQSVGVVSSFFSALFV
jgi:hypothetical protein